MLKIQAASIIDFPIFVLYNVHDMKLNLVPIMLPKIVSPSELRRNLASLLELAMHQVVVVTDKESNKVIIDEKEYNRLSALADQFMQEDPEGEYRPEFVKEVLRISREGEIDETVHSIRDVM